MDNSIDPASIPPPLRKGDSPANDSLVQVINQERDRTIFVGITSGFIGMLMMLVLVMAQFSSGEQSSDQLAGGMESGEVEGVLAGEDTAGSSLHSGGEISSDGMESTEAKGESSEVGESDTLAESLPTTTPSVEEQADPLVAAESSQNSTARGEQGADEMQSGEGVGAQEVQIARVPNRQNPLPGSHAGPFGNTASSAGGSGIDLGSKKGMNPFVGAGKPAASTVYVIDVSGSMQNQAKLPRVLNAMQRAIDQLNPKQTFCVLLFDSGYYFHPNLQGLKEASRTNKQMVKLWLAHAPGGLGTEPMEAMSIAIGLKSERIVLLSDGEFDPTIVMLITQLNHQREKRAKIDCVGLMEDVQVLRDIAQQNNGVYYQAW